MCCVVIYVPNRFILYNVVLCCKMFCYVVQCCVGASRYVACGCVRACTMSSVESGEIVVVVAVQDGNK
jgi:hypothetical protein